MKNKIILKWPIVIIFLSLIILLLTNKIYYPLEKIENKNIDTIYATFNKDNVDLSILLKSNKLDNEIITTTIPNISFFGKLPSNKYSNILKHNLYFDNSYWIKNSRFGGLILYDFNTPQILKYGGVKRYINILKRIMSLKIYVKDTINKQNILFTINPFIFSDLDYPLTKRKPEYERLKNILLDTNLTSKDIIAKYSEYGINSFLGPNVDFQSIDSNFKTNINNLIVDAEKLNEIICLKHFCYDQNKGNTHIQKSINNKILEKLINEDLYPYKYVDEYIKKPYLIMVGHHIISNIDSIYIASKSLKVKNLIRKEFKNAVTISDEITMQASSNKNIFFNDFTYIKDIKTDIILSHGGNIKNYRNKLIYNVSKINSRDKNEKILKILKLKNAYKLVETSNYNKY
jgi:hypothetical protein